MLEYELLRFRPSHLAAAATCLAQLYATDMDGLRWDALNVLLLCVGRGGKGGETVPESAACRMLC
jgi:hypothetical protein